MTAPLLASSLPQTLSRLAILPSIGSPRQVPFIRSVMTTAITGLGLGSRPRTRKSKLKPRPPYLWQSTLSMLSAPLGRYQTRAFAGSASWNHGHVNAPKSGEELWVTFIEKDGKEYKFAVAEGDNLLDIAQANDMDMEGACGGSCACSTCHVVVTDEEYYDKMPEPEDDENDMLDLAFGLTETSRLGCQVKMTKDLDGLKVRLPAMTRNMQATDFKS